MQPMLAQELIQQLCHILVPQVLPLALFFQSVYVQLSRATAANGCPR